MMNKIIDILKAMVQLHQSLNQLAEEKTEVVKKGDIKALNQMINQEEALTQKLTQLEEARQKLVNNFLGNIQENVSFSQLIEKAPEEAKPTLQDLQEKLATEVATLKQRNDLNQQLIRQSLDWVELNLNLLDPKPKSPTYGRPNTKVKQQAQSTRSRFDSQA